MRNLVLLMLFVHHIPSLETLMNGRCSTTSGNLTTCCAHYYLKNGDCIECKNGSQRNANDDTSKCKLCEEGKYGYRCSYNCDCTLNTMCSRFNGECICANGTNRCEKLQIVKTEETRNNTIAGIFVVFGLVGVVLFIFKVLHMKYIKDIPAENNNNGKEIRSCIHYYINKIYSLYRGNTSTDANTIENEDEGHYSDIRESAMIKSFDIRGVSVDLGDCDEYNHLQTNLKTDERLMSEYGNNVYTKMANIQNSRNRVALPNYDKMDV